MKESKFLILVSSTIVGLVVAIIVAGSILMKSQNISSQKLDHSKNEIIAQEPNLLSSGNDDTFEIVGYGELEINKDYPNINLINSSETMSIYLLMSYITMRFYIKQTSSHPAAWNSMTFITNWMQDNIL